MQRITLEQAENLIIIDEDNILGELKDQAKRRNQVLSEMAYAKSERDQTEMEKRTLKGVLFRRFKQEAEDRKEKCTDATADSLIDQSQEYQEMKRKCRFAELNLDLWSAKAAAFEGGQRASMLIAINDRMIALYNSNKTGAALNVSANKAVQVEASTIKEQQRTLRSRV